jgi:hypothetical protein
MELKNLAKLSRQLKGGQERNAHNQQVNTGTFQLSRQLRIAQNQLGKTVLKLSRQLRGEYERNVHNQQVYKPLQLSRQLKEEHERNVHKISRNINHCSSHDSLKGNMRGTCTISR